MPRCDHLTINRTLALVVACVAKLVAGSTSVFSIYANSVKELFGYTQTEVAVIAAMHAVGSNMVLPAGLIYDRFGPMWTSITGLVISTLGYSLVYSAVLAPGYYSTKSGLFSFYFFLTNHGVLYFYMASLVTSVKNFRPNHRAKVVALLDTFYGAGMAVFFSLYSAFFINGHVEDEQHQNLQGFILMLLLITVFTYVFCILFLRVYPVSDEEDQDQYEMGVQELCTGTTEEREPLAKTPECTTSDDGSQCEYIKTKLPRTVFSIKFICLMLAFILIAGCTGMFMANLTAITKSVHLTRLNWPLTTAMTVAGIAIRFILSPLSDYLYPKVPRAVFLICGDLLSALSYFLLIFYMDSPAALYMAVVLVGISISASYTFGTTILSEHFGTANLGLHFGIFKLFDAVTSFSLQTAFGEIYDAQIPNITSGSRDCYGKQCARGSLAMATVASAVAVVAALGFLLKQMWDRNRRN